MTLEACHVHLTPLSPVHVGCGESFEPTNYVIEDRWLHAFDTGAAIDALTPADRKELLDIGNRKPDLGMLKDVQRFFHERREALAPFSTLQLPVLDSIAKLHASRVGNVAQREEGGRDIINRLAIDRTSFDRISGRPVLYGSSIKGAIRTALLNEVNEGRSAHEREGLHLFQGRLLKYLNERSRPDIELDPLRLLHVSDMRCAGDAVPPHSQVWYAVDRKKAEVRDAQGNLRRSQAEAKELYQILECLLPWQYRGFSGQLTIRHVDGVASQDRRGRRLLPEAALRPTIDRIAKACNRFYRQRLDAELDILALRGYVDEHWQRAIQQLMKEAEPELAAGRMLLLRVGRHSGAESVTLDGVRRIKIIEGKDSATNKQRSSTADVAKTIWLASREKDHQADLLPFGWLLAEMEPVDSAPRRFEPLAVACRDAGQPGRGLAEALAKRRSELDGKRRQIEEQQRRLAEEAKRRAAAQVEAERVKAEEQKRRSAMPANLKTVEDFIDAMRQRSEQLRGGKERANTESHQRAQRLAKQALEGADWTDNEKRAAADAIEQWLPKIVQLPDVKDAFKKLKLRALRGES